MDEGFDNSRNIRKKGLRENRDGEVQVSKKQRWDWRDEVRD